MYSERPMVDGWICSYPKSGRTWLRFMIAQYLKTHLDLDFEADFHDLFTLLPNEGDDPERGIPAFRFSDDPRVPLIASSHRRFDSEVIDGAPVVFLSRDPLDVVVSQYFHRSRQHGGARSLPMGDFLPDATRNLAGYLNSWVPALEGPNILSMTYEAMSVDPKLELRRALSWFEIDIDEASLAVAVDRSSFDAMRTIEVEKGIAGHQYDRDDPEALRVRRGIVGGHSDYMTNSDVRMVEDVLSETLSPDARAWSARHR